MLFYIWLYSHACVVLSAVGFVASSVMAVAGVAVPGLEPTQLYGLTLGFALIGYCISLYSMHGVRMQAAVRDRPAHGGHLHVSAVSVSRGFRWAFAVPLLCVQTARRDHNFPRTGFNAS